MWFTSPEPMAAGFISQEEVIMALGWKASNVF
jgi:hypothetical protein